MYNYNMTRSKPIDIMKPIKYKKKNHDISYYKNNSSSLESPPINMTSYSPQKSINYENKIKKIYIRSENIKNKDTVRLLLRLSIPILYVQDIESILEESNNHTKIYIMDTSEEKAINYCRNLIENGLMAFYE